MTLSSATRAPIVSEAVPESVQPHVEKRACKRRGCRVEPRDDSEYCDEHARRQRQYDAAYKARRRAAWARAKRCTQCGAAKRRPGFKRCSACVAKERKALRGSVQRQVENKSARIAARLIAWVNSPQNAGRMRLRGGTRGRPRIEDENRLDLEEVQKDFPVAVDALIDADAEYQKLVPAIQRQNTREAAAARWLLVAKWALVIARRNGGALPTTIAELIGDSDDESET
jgi:hypothetical protein